MAVVIPFAPQRRPQSASAGSLPPQTAEILFFTGVRYERAPEARPPAAKASPIAPAGRYIVEFTPDLLQPDWREVPGVFDGNDWRGTATGLQGFYRIRETP